MITAPTPNGDAGLYWLASFGRGAAFDRSRPLGSPSGPRAGALNLRLPEGTGTALAEVADCVVLLDGELHNRTQLERAAGIRRHPPGSDASLVLDAFRAAGDRVIGLVRGGCTMVIWDGRNDRVILVRDRLGVRPLFYGTHGDSLFFSPSPEVLASSTLGAAVNDINVAEWVLRSSTDIEETFYENVSRLPPGHLLEYRSGRARISQYWRPPKGDRLASADPREGFEEFDRLLRQAVRRQCETAGRHRGGRRRRGWRRQRRSPASSHRMRPRYRWLGRPRR